ncbi:hypothetical protein [uncultured Kiloniella sp.]|uniref:hypothetical protein n=1 Tax=uncultured Kiloniella sp. TaxID=1133091 RepID=UPI0026160632|nr:hypothetical protein [uncultured Kiloniella sp.]
MSNKIDFAQIKQAAIASLPNLLNTWLPQGRLDGVEYKSINPTRADSKEGSFSINVETGVWGDFASGDTGGDPIDLYAYLFGMEGGEAARELAKDLGLSSGNSKDRDISQRANVETKPKAPVPEPIFPVPDTAPPLMQSSGRTVPLYNPKKAGSMKEFTSFKPTLVHPYRDREGHLLGYVIRVDMPDGKITPPITFCKLPDGSEKWCLKGFPEPRPIYGMEQLDAKPDATVILVEGEKSCDAGIKLFPSAVVVTWPGGSKSSAKVEWSALYGRKVIAIHDNDKPGIDGMAGFWKVKENRPPQFVNGVQQHLAGLAKLLIVSPEPDREEGWDICDGLESGWSQDDAKQWLDARIKKAVERGPIVPHKPEPPKDDEPPQLEPNDYGPEDSYGDMTGYAETMSYDPPEDETPFRILGHNRGKYYYLSNSASQIVELSATGHNKLNLLQIAPMDYWESHYPKKGSPDWDMAANALINIAHSVGIFRPEEHRRGRGAWLDNGRAVLHLGDVLIVDGQPMSPITIKSRYTYEGDTSLGIEPKRPATNKEAHTVVEICNAVQWENDLSATCLAGWMIIAPVCGMLNWRPHIWITGPSGSGKSTVITDIVSNIVGPMALKVASKTTEAGIRYGLGADALPVIFDEAEGEDFKSAERMQAVLDLARVASSDSGAKLLKGSANGTVQQFLTRSMFCFASINNAVQHYADETRVTLLSLRPNSNKNEEERQRNEENYSRLLNLIHSQLTPEFAAALVMRSVANLKTIKKNADTFAKAAAIALKDRRVGDQIGAMLAGAYLCHSTKVITFERAIQWIKEHDWSEHTSIDAESDENRLLHYILEYELTVNAGNGSHYKRTVGELITGALDDQDDENIPSDLADKTLRRYGIRVDSPSLTGDTSGGIKFSTTSNHLKRMLKETQWSASFRTTLIRIEGARKSANNVRFTTALSTPAIILPITLFQ